MQSTGRGWANSLVVMPDQNTICSSPAPSICVRKMRIKKVGLRALASGLCPLASGLWLLASGLRALASGTGLWPPGSGLRALASGLRALASRLWPLSSGLWPPATGLPPLALPAPATEGLVAQKTQTEATAALAALGPHARKTLSATFQNIASRLRETATFEKTSVSPTQNTYF